MEIQAPYNELSFEGLFAAHLRAVYLFLYFYQLIFYFTTEIQDELIKVKEYATFKCTANNPSKQNSNILCWNRYEQEKRSF